MASPVGKLSFVRLPVLRSNFFDNGHYLSSGWGISMVAIGMLLLQY